jgi:hypothetical protein
LSPKSAALLENPHPRNHIVYPYTTDAEVTDVVSLFASSGLRNGEAVVLVVSRAHCEPIRRRLGEQGFSVQELEATGQLVCQDAQELLDTFMFDGIIDQHRFKTILDGMIRKAKSASSHRSVRIFGEMVDLIWRTRAQTTQRLEELWNDVIEEHSVPLLCAYSLAGTKTNSLPGELVAPHSHAVA